MQAIIERLCYVGVRSDEIMEEISKEEFEVNDAPKYKDLMKSWKRFQNMNSKQTTGSPERPVWTHT